MFFYLTFSYAQHTHESRLKMHMQSQILGAGVLLGALVFSVGIVSISRCFFNYHQLPDMNDLAAMEKEILYHAFGEKLEKLVKVSFAFSALYNY